tara:strand:- start:1697 stop:2077 length:381 start_codon:yes stop_codon:yes gene_type:complete
MGSEGEFIQMVEPEGKQFTVKTGYGDINYLPMYKFGEDVTLNRIKEYVDQTYQQHYSQNKFQATEFILDGDHGSGFCIGNIFKYAQRYGKKGNPDDWERDIMKVIHYAIILLHDHRMKYNGSTTTD